MHNERTSVLPHQSTTALYEKNNQNNCVASHFQSQSHVIVIVFFFVVVIVFNVIVTQYSFVNIIHLVLDHVSDNA